MNRRAGILLLGVLCYAPVASAERLPIRTYTTADGLPHNLINRIVRDSRGFLWFCTGDGLSRFDGYAFTNYGIEQDLPFTNVTDFLETRAHQYWIGTTGGLVRFSPTGPARSMFTAVPSDPPSASLPVTRLVEDTRGVIWVGTSKGLFRLDDADGHPRLAPIDIGLPRDFADETTVNAILADRGGSLWLATPTGLYRRWPDGTHARYTRRDGLPDDFIHDLREDRHGALWAATRTAGAFQFTAVESHAPPVVVRALSTRDGLPSPWVFGLLESADGALWFATANGLACLDESAGRPVLRSYGVRHGLSYHEITALNEDASGNLWLGTNTTGVMKLVHGGITTYDRADGLTIANAIFEDENGAMCVRGTTSPPAGATIGVDRYGCLAAGHFDWFRPAIFTRDLDLGWVMEDVTLRGRGGDWWLGTGSGIYRFPPTPSFADLRSRQPIAHFELGDGLASRQVFRLFQDSRGDVWASTIASARNGLALWSAAENRWRDLARADGVPSLSDDLARSFGEDASGDVWIGFSGGAARSRGGHFTFFGPADGLPRGAIVDILRDRNGRLWLASAGSGLIRVDAPDADHPHFAIYAAAQGLSSARTSVLVDDALGRIYVGTGQGLDRLDPDTGQIRHFTTADGLASGTFLCAFRDRQGVLWFGLTGGLSRLVPASESATSPPPIFINGLVVGSEPRPVSAVGETNLTLVDLAPGENRLQIDFVGLSFAPGETLRYEYQLEGADRRWTAPSPQRSVNYANLAPGRYRFLVRARTANGTESRAPAEIVFRILPPVWARWWFLALAGMAAIVGGRWAYRARTARLVELANVRGRIALDLHDDIGSNLTKIAILSEVAQRGTAATDGPAEQPLSDIARISRESIEAMSDIVWATNPQRDRMVDLVRRMRQHAEEVLTGRGVRVIFNEPGDPNLRLDVGVRRDVFLMFKEAINNIARHAACASVQIDLRVEGSALSLSIRDDGRGFDDAASYDGSGLVSMRQRAARLGGRCDVRSAAGTGTTVLITIPAGTARRRRTLREQVGDRGRPPR